MCGLYGACMCVSVYSANLSVESVFIDVDMCALLMQKYSWIGAGVFATHYWEREREIECNFKQSPYAKLVLFVTTVFAGLPLLALQNFIDNC